MLTPSGSASFGRPVTYIQVRSTVTAPNTAIVGAIRPKIVDTEGKSQRDHDPANHRTHGSRCDPLPLLLHIGGDVAHESQRKEQEAHADRAAEDVPRHLQHVAQVDTTGQPPPDLGPKVRRMIETMISSESPMVSRIAKPRTFQKGRPSSTS